MPTPNASSCKNSKDWRCCDYFSIVALQIATIAAEQHGLPFDPVWDIVTELNLIIHGRQKFGDPFEFDDFTDQLFAPKFKGRFLQTGKFHLKKEK
jgi:hypothetical protein